MNGRGRRAGTLVGTFRSWKEPWGFVVCPTAFEGDIFAHREHFVGAAPAGDLTGRRCQFEHAIDQKGRAHAAMIRVLDANGHGDHGSGVGRSAPSSSGSAGPRRHSIIGVGYPTGFNQMTFGQAPVMMIPAIASNRGPSADVQRLVGTRLRGEIRSWKGDWGFIVCPKRFEGDIFVHRGHMQMDGEPQPGDQVSFTVTIDPKNRVAASEVTAASQGPEDFLQQGVLPGQVRSWRNDWGFIVSEQFEGDLFCHQDSLVNADEVGDLEGSAPGLEVSFEVGKDKRGRICAEQVTFLDVGAAPLRSPPQSTEKALPRRQAKAGAVAKLEVVEAEAEAEAEEELHGTLRSWRDPWGFIVCPEQFEGDLFVHKGSFVEAFPPDAELAGSKVAFHRSTDARGRLGATQVRFLDVLRQDAKPPLANSVKPDAIVDDSVITGTIRSWKDDWGFIVAPEHFEGDIFAHKDHLSGGDTSLAAGSTVTFQVGVDSKGRKTAMSITCTNTAEDWIDEPVRIRGSFRTWKHPWGFIVSSNFSGDLFSHTESFGPYMPIDQMQPGMWVAFYVKRDQRGRCTASDVMPAPPPGGLGKRAIGGPIIPAKRQRILH